MMVLDVLNQKNDVLVVLRGSRFFRFNFCFFLLILSNGFILLGFLYLFLFFFLCLFDWVLDLFLILLTLFFLLFLLKWVFCLFLFNFCLLFQSFLKLNLHFLLTPSLLHPKKDFKEPLHLLFILLNIINLETH